jgi:large subunit ribosomal protein L24
MKKIRKGDSVVVIAGKDKGKQGVVLERVSKVSIRVEGINRVKKHTKPNPAKGQAGGIVDKEMPINVSNIALFNSQTKKADRVGVKRSDSGRNIRVYKSSGQAVDA